jgi:sigma-B regulation protein RsbU (phosphoserine phosphatase)
LSSFKLFSNPIITGLESKLNSMSEKDKLSCYLTLDSLLLPSNPIKAIDYSEKAVPLAQKLQLKFQESEAYLYLAKANGIIGEINKSSEYVDKSLKIKEQIGDKRGIASGYNIKANLQTIIGDVKGSLEYYLKSIEIREEIKDSSGLSSSLNNLGILYRNLGNISKALDYYQKSLEISLKLNDVVVLSNTYKNIGNIYVDMKRTEEAKKYFLMSHAISIQFNDSLQMTASMLDLGNVYLKSQKVDSALYYFKKGYYIAKVRGIAKLFPIYLNNISVAFIKTNKYDSASFYLKIALKITENSVDKSIIIATYLNLGDLYIKTKDYKKAKYYLETALHSADSINSKSTLIELYQSMAELYSQTGNFKEAFHYKDLYANLKDTVFDESLNQKIQNIQISNSLDQKEKEIEILKKDYQLLEKSQEIHKQERIYLIILSIFVVLIGVIIYSRYRAKIKANKLLTEKNTEITNQSNQIENDILNASNYIYSLLPNQFENKGIKARWQFVPCSRLGGDSFGYHWLDEENFAIYLFDISGHGIGAALHSVAVLNNLKHQTLPNADFYSPKDVLSKLNNLFQMKRHNNLFFTIWYGVYNINSRILKYSSAGHPPALYIFGNDENVSLSQKNPFIGGINDFNFVDDKLNIEKNSVLYIYSDGVYEIFKPDGTIWEQSELNKYLLDNYYKANDSEIVQLYKHVIDIHGSQHLDDDFSLLKIEFE